MLSRKSEHAIYLPAISANYAKLGHSVHLKGSFSFSEKDLNFLDPSSGLFHYPYALYSAGQAAKTDGAAKMNSIVSHRNRDLTTVIGDSGGFQIQEGTIKFAGDATCKRMLRWMEHHADYSMTLDFPTGGISSGNVAQHTARLNSSGEITAMSAANGLSLDYNACLKQSLLNLDYFVANRVPGKTNFLNVIQGRTERESKVWYEGVKSYPLEGIAFAGAHQSAFSLTVARLLDMYDDGILQSAKWIHFLGISTLEPAYLFNTLLRCIRSYNSSIGISFDTSSPFISAANFNMYTTFRYDKYGCGLATISFPEHVGPGDSRTLNELARGSLRDIVVKRGAAPEIKFPLLPVETAIGSKVYASKICEIQDGRLRVTTDGVWVLMNHNVEVFKKTFESLNKSFDQNPLHDNMGVHVRGAKVAIELIFKELDSKGSAAARTLLKESAFMLDIFAEMRN